MAAPTRILYVPHGELSSLFDRANADIVIEGDRITKDRHEEAEVLLTRIALVTLREIAE